VEKKGENGDDGGVEGVYHVILALTDDVSYREACARVIPMHELVKLMQKMQNVSKCNYTEGWCAF
jgi:hypothetical protein